MADKDVISLSVDETNALRAKLGLKPLNVQAEDASQSEDAQGPAPGTSSIKNDVLLAPRVPGAEEREEEMRAKLMTSREKREFHKKLAQVKTHGQDDDEDIDDVASWVKKSRTITKAKKEAEKKAAELAAMDEDFGADDIQTKEYGSNDLKGLKVKHDLGSLQDESVTILTLADRNVLDDDGEDELVNVNIAEDERRQRMQANAKRKADDPLDEDPLGLKRKKLLSKYDDVDVLSGDKTITDPKGFRIGQKVPISEADELDAEYQAIKEKLKNTESLEVQSQDVSDFYTKEEVASFKKKKKKRKVKKKKQTLNADDLLGIQHQDDSSVGGGQLNDIDSTVVTTATLDEDDILNANDDYEDAEGELELQMALARARRAKANKQKMKTVAELLGDSKPIKMEEEDDELQSEEAKSGLVFSDMTEFVRTVGLEEDDEEDQKPHIKKEPVDSLPVVKMETEEDRVVKKEEPDEVHEDIKPKIDFDDEQKEETLTDIMGEEDSVGSSLAAALNIARKKGYIERNKVDKKPVAKSSTSSISSSRQVQEQRRGRRRDRDRDSENPLNLKGYKPSFVLEYKDGERSLTAKQAFTKLSHVFHGKASGKNKVAKIQRRQEEEERAKTMASEDTPLGMAEAMRKQQQKSGNAHIVLSGHKL